jgi:hypothetical protein
MHAYQRQHATPIPPLAPQGALAIHAREVNHIATIIPL